MTIVTSYPGVYVQEDTSITISVNSRPTAVPIFILDNDNPFSASSVVRFDSWMDYVNKVYEVEGNSYVMSFSDSRDAMMRAYFENGGGYCYACADNKANSLIPLYDDITLVVAGTQTSMTSIVGTLCVPGSGRFAILNGPQTQLSSSYDPSKDFSSNSCAAAYYPWLTASWSTTDISPSAVMAGIYCAVDRARGVWKAPANVALSGGLQPKYRVNDSLQGQFNQGLAINMIRTFETADPIVWGARTLEDSDNWRYIPVRRLFNSAERDIKSTMNTMVFEPNTPPTWEKVRTAITNYLHNLWRQGALLGSTEKEAYFVQIGKGVTMTDDDIAQGRMIATVGMAAVRPAEFIILQFTQNVEQ